MGTRVIDSTPPAMVMSHTPDWMRFAAKWIPCWLEPHCRSTVVAGSGDGKAGGEPCVAPDVETLLAGLGHATEYDVFNLLGCDARALDELSQHERAENDRVLFLELSVSPS